MPKVKIADLTMDPRLQARVKLSKNIVDEYAELVSASKRWPFKTDVDVVKVDGVSYVVDGFKRVAACLAAGQDSVSANVTNGTWDDAIKAACGANADHGEQRTHGDKRRALSIAMNNFPSLGALALAKMCKCSASLASAALQESDNEEAKKRASKFGGAKKKGVLKKPATAKKKAVEEVTEENIEQVVATTETTETRTKTKAAQKVSKDVSVGVACPSCGCNRWELTDGGRVCEQCGFHEDGLSIPMVETAEPTSTGPTVGPMSGDEKLVKLARSSFGKLVRALDDMGLADSFEGLLAPLQVAIHSISIVKGE